MLEFENTKYYNYFIYMNELRNQGYIIIPNNNNELFQQKMMTFYQNNNKINYKELRSFVDNIFFPDLMNKINNNEKIFYSKFRFSNNNNSSDASTFHGDCYNYTNDEIINQYTCLYYFDNAEFEIIPETHKKNKYKTFNEAYNKKIRINIKPGTFVIIHSNLHHRGVNFTKTTNRRLLQVFDVYLNKKDYDFYRPKFIIVKTQESFIIKLITKMLYYIYKHNDNITSENLNYLHYYLVFNNLQYKIMNLPSKKDNNKILSYQSGNQCIFEDSEKIKETNVNIVCNKDLNYKSPDLFYLNCYLIYWVVSLILIFLISRYKDKIKKNFLIFLKKHKSLKRFLKK